MLDRQATCRLQELLYGIEPQTTPTIRQATAPLYADSRPHIEMKRRSL